MEWTRNKLLLFIEILVFWRRNCFDYCKLVALTPLLSLCGKTLNRIHYSPIYFAIGGLVDDMI